MNPSVTSLVIFVIVFGAALLGMQLRIVYPKRQLGPRTESTVILAIKLVAMMTALLLGLLVTSAKSNYDAQKGEMTAMSAKIVLLDRVLSAYGPETADARAQLRDVVEQMIARIWPRGNGSQLDPSEASGAGVLEAVLTLSPRNDAQRLIKGQAITIGLDVGEMRWLLYAQTNYGLPALMLVMLIAWLAIIFFSYGLFADANGTVIAVLFVAALTVSGAVLVIMALDHPFSGVMRIASTPMEMALAHLGH